MNRSARYSTVGVAAVFITAVAFLVIARVGPDGPPEISQEKRVPANLISNEDFDELFPLIKADPSLLTPVDQCHIEILLSRGNKVDQCLAECTFKLLGNLYMGGCPHVCGSRGAGLWNRDYEYPEGFFECREKFADIQKARPD